jgi:hypothetical protein
LIIVCISCVINPCPSVRPSFRMAQIRSHWTVIYKIVYWGFSLKCAHKIKIWLTSDEANINFIWRNKNFYDFFANNITMAIFVWQCSYAFYCYICLYMVAMFSNITTDFTTELKSSTFLAVS